jgi:hypothetical protein
LSLPLPAPRPKSPAAPPRTLPAPGPGPLPKTIHDFRATTTSTAPLPPAASALLKSTQRGGRGDEEDRRQRARDDDAITRAAMGPLHSEYTACAFYPLVSRHAALSRALSLALRARDLNRAREAQEALADLAYTPRPQDGDPPALLRRAAALLPRLTARYDELAAAGDLHGCVQALA